LLRHLRLLAEAEGGIVEPVPKRKRGISFLAMTKRGVTNHMNEYTDLTI